MGLKSDRIFGLDLFRATAIILVVLGHGNHFLKDTRFSNFPYFKMIDGVDLFFVLSGFLIGTILLKEINKGEKFALRSLFQFWKRRWFRTLPNYYLILLVNFVLVRWNIIHGDILQFNWKFFVFLQNFSSPFYDFFWESWSLSVEEWFYVLTPIFLLFLLKIFPPKQSFMLVVSLMIIMPLLYRVYLFNPTIDDFWYDVSLRKLVVTRLDSIAFGLLSSWIFYYFKNQWEKFKVHSFLLGIGLIIMILNFQTSNTSFYNQVITFSITPIAAALLLPLMNSIQHINGMIPKMITHVSKISYSMYLINLAVVSAVMTDHFAPKNEVDGILKYVLYWMLVIGLSTVLYYFFERPMLKLRGENGSFS
jgi:peptidoglycan/LPS O-acetylase OafA/YrhL